MSTSQDRIEVLNQEIDDEKGLYRIRAGNRVHYLTILTNVFDEDTMCRPYLLIPQLPNFPDYEWTSMSITRDEDSNAVQSTISSEPLRGIDETWHPQRIDVLEIARKIHLKPGVHEVLHNGKPAIAKIACFEWHIPRINHETWAYRILAENRLPDEGPFAPEFLAHITEGDRVIGFLLDKAEGDAAGPEDLESCEALLRRLHALGLVHGDVNRYSFLVNRKPGGVTLLVDFEHAEGLLEETASQELKSLASELAEDTRRGKPLVFEC